jgi:large subunit ribosomal protein L10
VETFLEKFGRYGGKTEFRMKRLCLANPRQRRFFGFVAYPSSKGGEGTLAISKERKKEMVDEYVEWVNNSRALILTEYTGLDMKQMDDLRAKTREAGGEFHIIKNTLSRVAFEQLGIPMPEGYFEGSTAIGFAFQDAPALAKTLTEFARASEELKIKGGYLDQRVITADEIRALAELPPLPVMRAQLLGTILAPASKLVRTLVEPGRSLAAVIQAYIDQQNGGGEAVAETAEAAA